MIRKIIFIFLCFSCSIALGQLEGTNWYFGRYAGLEFSTGTPQPIYDGQLSTSEGCASVSNKTGGLLFYTDGRFVYDKNHNVMPNGAGLMGDPSSVQSAVVCPKPGTWNTVLGQFDGYIICTVDNMAGPNGIRWSEVDMTANAGNGDVVAATKNTLLIGTTTVEAANFAKHENGCDYWLLTKEVGNNTWRVFPVTNSGVGSVPVTSNQGPNTPAIWGTIKASPNSDIVALSNRNAGVHIYDFDKLTGQLGYRYGDNIGNHYSLEFSPNGELIYYTCLTDPNIYQLDLNSANQVDFVASKIAIGTTGNTAHVYRLGALQLGPDGKIYLALRSTTFLGVINNPDLIGAAANYLDFAVDIGGTNTNGSATEVILGLPSFPTFFFIAEQSIVYNQFCNTLDGTLSLSSYENIEDQYWYVTPSGSAFGGAYNSADSSYLTTLPAGEYDVKVVMDYGCFLDSVFKTIEVAPIPEVLELGNDTCFVSNFVLDLGPNYDLIEWQDGTGNQTFTVDQHGTYFCEVGSIGGNLVTNGDFEDGNIGFSSAYDYSSNAVNQGSYTVGTTIPNAWWANCADHTTGTGNMIIADAACGTNGVATGADLWCQTIYVQPNTDYIFSAWLANGNINNSTAQLGFYADGAIIGGAVTSSALTCDWNQYSQVWNSGTSTTVDICLKELSGTCSGADFIVDDIAFSPICYQTDTIEVYPSPQASFVAAAVCANAQSDFMDQSTTATGTIDTWSWDFDDSGSIDASTQNPSNTYASSGVYQANLVVENSHGCSDDTTISVTVNPLPTATVTGTITVCQGDADPTITFTGANGTAPYTFTYTINGGADQTIVSTGNTATVTASTVTAGTFDYNLLSVADASATVCSQVQIDLATVTVNTLPTATIAGTVTVCQGDAAPTITFTGANGTAPYTFTYNINGGADQTIVSTGNTATLAAPTGVVGSFDYNLVSVADASASICSQAQVDVATVTVNPLPTATIAGTVSVCQGDAAPTITFTGADGTAPYVFTYNINNTGDVTITSTGSTATITVPTVAAGVYNFNLVSVSDASSTVCSQIISGTATVTVNDLPVVFAGDDAIICEGDQITLSGQGALSYVWDQGVVDGVPFTPAATSTYTVVGTDVNGCSNTDDVVIAIEPEAVVSFTGDVLSGCEPLKVSFTNTTPGSFDECVWTIGNGATITGCGSVTTIFSSAGTYDVTLTTTTAIGCVASATYTDYIYVEAIPEASFIPSSTLIHNFDPEVNFENTSIGAVTYEWDFGDGSPISTAFSPSYTYPIDVSGNYLVELVAYSPLGCSDSAYINIELVEEVIYYIPNTFTPDGDAFNQRFQPVFTSGYDPYDFELLIFNRWGEIIFESHDASIGWDGTFGGKMVQDGTYSWKIEFKTTNSDERKVVVGHVNMMR